MSEKRGSMTQHYYPNHTQHGRTIPARTTPWEVKDFPQFVDYSDHPLLQELLPDVDGTFPVTCTSGTPFIMKRYNRHHVSSRPTWTVHTRPPETPLLDQMADDVHLPSTRTRHVGSPWLTFFSGRCWMNSTQSIVPGRKSIKRNRGRSLPNSPSSPRTSRRPPWWEFLPINIFWT